MEDQPLCTALGHERLTDRQTNHSNLSVIIGHCFDTVTWVCENLLQRFSTADPDQGRVTAAKSGFTQGNCLTRGMSVPHEYVSHCQSTTYSTVTITACFHATLTCNSCRVFLPNIISTHQIRGRIQIRTYHNCTYHFNYTTVSNQYISIVLVLESWHKRRGIHYLWSQFIKKG